MIEYEGGKVSSSAHACEQALRRIPSLDGASRHDATRWIETTAVAALIEGRRAKTMPRWCSTGEFDHILYTRKKLRRYAGTYRFVWDEGETTVFALVHSHEKDHAFGAGWVVMTVMVPRST